MIIRGGRTWVTSREGCHELGIQPGLIRDWTRRRLIAPDAVITLSGRTKLYDLDVLYDVERRTRNRTKPRAKHADQQGLC